MPAPNLSDHPYPLSIAGVGASAGGLDALTKLVASLPDNGQLAVVIVQHVNPDHKSKMVELLGRHSRWPVVVAKDQLPIEGQHVYVTPPNCEITVEQGVITLIEEQRTVYAVPSVDRFLTSLAKDLEARAIAIILSGTGKDGTQGVAQIQAHGGYVMVQQPDEAQHVGMPESAIQSGHVNEVLGVSEMGEHLEEHLNRPPSADQEAYETSLQGIFRLMTQKTGTDFSKYKPFTIGRRLNKRLDALSLDSIDAYYQYLQENPDEIDTLFQTVLIGVTQFFRDQAAFERLRTYVEELVARKQPGEAIRVWSVGCATGEEPYSIAILIAEVLGDRLAQHTVQIFASDIDERALMTGRRGFYPEALVDNLTPEQLEQYFNKGKDGYEVKKKIRQWVLFSKHDINGDPPFVRLDLILCRNLLIYFNNDLQNKVIPVFHYALAPGGYLFLGKSENIMQLSNLFVKEDGQHKIFRKREGGEINTLRYTDFRRLKPDRSNGPAIRSELSLEELTNQALLQTFENPFLVVNDALDVVYLRGKLQPYVDLSEGALKANALKIVCQELHLELKTTFVKAKREGQPHKTNIIRFTSYNQEHLVRLAIKPFVSQRNSSEYYLVIFEQVSALAHYPLSADDLTLDGNQDQNAMRVMELEHELAATREHLQTFTEELETSNEELQAMNEELQSVNEELKSSNEELETGNEELQSANEELQAANAELSEFNEIITQKEAELTRINDELEINRDRFRLALSNSPIILFYQDTELRYTWQYNNHPDFKVEDVLGKSDYALLGDEYQEYIALKTKVLATGEPVRTTIAIGQLSYDVTVEPIYRETTVVGIKGVAIDITERVRADERLREKEQQISNITNNVADVIFESVTPAQGEPYFRFVSRAIVDIYEIQPQELTSNARKAFEVVHPDDLPEFLRLNDEALQQGDGIFVFEGRVVTPQSGTIKWIYISAKTKRQANGDTVWYGTITDVTALKQTQHELKEAKELAERAAQAKEDFLATMSHEIRTPLNAIVGISGLLLERNPRPEQIENLRALRFSSESLMALVNDILDFSKIEAGKVSIEQVPFSLASLLTSLQQAHRIQAQEGHNDLIIEQEPDVPTLVIGDPLKLGQVLNNLLSNALKFTKQGQVRLSVSLEAAHEDERTLLFSVQDTGIGIAPDKIEQIFDKFTQADNSTQRHFGGTGLGLSITRMLLELMGSSIQVESEAGRGARFYFSLTVKRSTSASEPVSRAEAPPASEEQRSSLRLLIVEDVAINRMILQQYLQDRLGVTADEAVNGEEAVELVAENEYNLVLMDVRMPVMDGYEATRLIRGMDDKKRTLPIIALTADTRDTLKSAEAVHFTDVITKPFDPNDLFAKIAQHCQPAVGGGTSGVQEAENPARLLVDFDTAEQQFRESKQKVAFYRLVSKAFNEHKIALHQAMEQRNSEQLDNLLHKLRTTFTLLRLDTLRQQLEHCAELLAKDRSAAAIDEAHNQAASLMDQVIQQVEQRCQSVGEASEA